MKTRTHKPQANVVEFTRVTDPTDAQFSHLRGEEVLQKLLRRYPNDRDSLQRAHQRLKGDPSYGPAMHRAAQSLHEGRIRAFISYREGLDAEAARAVADVFRELSAGKVAVTLADEFTGRIPGQDFKSETESAIKTAHWFIFLVSEAREPSAWCMYETGMFRAGITSKRLERLICISHPTATLSSAIDEYQAVQASVPHLQRFLDGQFRKPEPLPGWDALNAQLTDATILSAATRIANAFRPPRKPISFNYRVTLDVQHPERLKAPSELSSCLIETDRVTAELFGKVVEPHTWGELIANVRRKNSAEKWLEELLAVIKKASEGNAFRPITTTFESSYGGRVLRPVLDSMEHDGISPQYRFHLFFLEEILSAPVHSVPIPTLALLTAVRMNERIRWEVIQRFMNVQLTHSNIEACAKAFSRIEREVQGFGRLDVELLCSNYAEGVQTEVREMIHRWTELRNPQAGSLGSAFKKYDAERIRDGLIECRQLNRRFFELTFPVLQEVTKAEI